MGAIAGLALSLTLMMVAPAVSAADVTTTPPAKFKKVSSLVKLPDFVPGLGTLYVDPATLPIGPFLGYNHKGKLDARSVWVKTTASPWAIPSAGCRSADSIRSPPTIRAMTIMSCRFLNRPSPEIRTFCSPTIPKRGATFEPVFTVQGVYDYFCKPHEMAGMVGRIVVGDPGDGPGTKPFGDAPSEHWKPVPEAARKHFPQSPRSCRNERGVLADARCAAAAMSLERYSGRDRERDCRS